MRHWYPIIVRALELFWPPKTPRDELMISCAKCLSDIYKDPDNWNNASSPGVISTLARRHVIGYVELNRTSSDPSQLFRVYPKHHLFIHLCELPLTTGLNPLLEWCYGDESEIGLCALLTKRCHPDWACSTLLEKYTSLREGP